jgi:hypothetical protein
MGVATWTLCGPQDLPSASPPRSERLPIIRFVRGYRDGNGRQLRGIRAQRQLSIGAVAGGPVLASPWY